MSDFDVTVQDDRYTEIAVATWIERMAESYDGDARRALQLAAESIKSGVWCNRPSWFVRSED